MRRATGNERAPPLAAAPMTTPRVKMGAIGIQVNPGEGVVSVMECCPPENRNEGS
jgi:hypothetical protein